MDERLPTKITEKLSMQPLLTCVQLCSPARLCVWLVLMNRTKYTAECQAVWAFRFCVIRMKARSAMPWCKQNYFSSVRNAGTQPRGEIKCPCVSWLQKFYECYGNFTLCYSVPPPRPSHHNILLQFFGLTFVKGTILLNDQGSICSAASWTDTNIDFIPGVELWGSLTCICMYCIAGLRFVCEQCRVKNMQKDTTVTHAHTRTSHAGVHVFCSQWLKKKNWKFPPV